MSSAYKTIPIRVDPSLKDGEYRLEQSASNMVQVKVDVYEVIQDPTGRVKALRHGLDWRDLTGDNLVLSMAYEIEKLREIIRLVQ